MKFIYKITVLVALVALISLALPGRALAASPADDKIIFGGAYTLENGQTLDGNLAVFGGTATIEEGATVNGDVILAGGTINLSGEVDGNMILFGGAAFLEDGSVVNGDVNTFGAALHRSGNAEVKGRILSGSGRPFNFDVPGNWIAPNYGINLNPLWDLFGFIARTLAMAALAILIVLLAPHATNRTAAAAFAQPVVAGGIGFLTVVLAVPVLILVTITILLIPLSLLTLLLLILAVIYGWIALGLEFGKKTAELFKTEWPLPLAAGIGTLILSVVTNAIGFIPCVGWLAPFLVGIVGLGAVLLTRFGNRPYPLPPLAPVGPSVSPIAPVRPVAPVGPQVYPTAPEPPAAPSRVEVYPTPDEPLPPQDTPQSEL